MPDLAEAPLSNHLLEELSYRHMLALADAFEEWALDKQVTAAQSVRLAGNAAALREMADGCGPNWNPPAPERLTLLGFLARTILREGVDEGAVG